MNFNLLQSILMRQYTLITSIKKICSNNSISVDYDSWQLIKILRQRFLSWSLICFYFVHSYAEPDWTVVFAIHIAGSQRLRDFNAGGFPAHSRTGHQSVVRTDRSLVLRRQQRRSGQLPPVHTSAGPFPADQAQQGEQVEQPRGEAPVRVQDVRLGWRR